MCTCTGACRWHLYNNKQQKQKKQPRALGGATCGRSGGSKKNTHTRKNTCLRSQQGGAGVVKSGEPHGLLHGGGGACGCKRLASRRQLRFPVLDGVHLHPATARRPGAGTRTQHQEEAHTRSHTVTYRRTQTRTPTVPTTHPPPHAHAHSMPQAPQRTTQVTPPRRCGAGARKRRGGDMRVHVCGAAASTTRATNPARSAGHVITLRPPMQKHLASTLTSGRLASTAASPAPQPGAHQHDQAWEPAGGCHVRASNAALPPPPPLFCREPRKRECQQSLRAREGGKAGRTFRLRVASSGLRGGCTLRIRPRGPSRVESTQSQTRKDK
jgi:hypothetical protein